MKDIRGKIAFVFISFYFITLCPQSAWSWCWIRDTGKTDASCTSGTTYQATCCSGNLQVWPGATMEYRISNSTSNTLLTYIRNGANLWTNVAMSTFTFTEGARTSEWDYQYDSVNTFNIDSSFCTHYGAYCSQGILGFSGTWTSTSGGFHAVENDVILNGEEFNWGDGTGGTQNTVAVVAHELGHSAGLTHPGSTCRSSGSAGCGPEFQAATMYWNYSYGQPTNKDNLELDEVAALVYGYPTSTLRVRVLDSGGSAVSGATVELIGSAAPVNGTSIATGGSVRGDITASLMGDGVSSTTYVNSTPFSSTDGSGYTNYINPVHQSFSVRATSGSNTVTQAVTAAAGTSTVTVQFGGSTYSALADAVDNTSLAWSTGGNGNWDRQTATAFYGGDAAQSGNISDNGTSWVQTTVTGPVTLTFYWKVSSEATYDFLRFYIDDAEETKISGNVDWQQKSYAIGSGSHTCKWAYTKDYSYSSGSDAGWLDKVVTTVSTCPSCSGNNVTLQNVTFPAGTTCECIGTTSIAIGTGVTVENGATVTFRAPTVTVDSGFHAENGASVAIRQ